MKSSFVLLVALFAALASTTPSPNEVCIANGGHCQPGDHCCPDTKCVNVVGKGPLPLSSCRRICTEEYTECNVDVDCCVGNICKDDPGFGKFCVPNHPPSKCTEEGPGCRDDNECCGGEETVCRRKKNYGDPRLCVKKSCKTSGQPCSDDDCCPGLKCNGDGIHNGLPRCIRK